MENLKQAKEIIAAYLVGGRVTQEMLQQAYDMLRKEEPDALRRLKDGLISQEDWIDECDMFRENVAEFCEMSIEERHQEMSVLVYHMESCLKCRRLYWEIRPMWIMEAATAVKRAIKETVKQLSESIQIHIDQTGQLIEKGGPPSLEFQTVAATMGAPELIKEWVLKDEDENCHIRLTFRGRTSGYAEIKCEITDATKIPVGAGEMRIELREKESQNLYGAGPLSDLIDHPLILPSGSWEIQIKWTRPKEPYIWKIPIDLNPLKSVKAGV